MKIVKFEGKTEREALDKARAGLGRDAVILSTKKVPPRGFFAFLRHGTFELSAVYDEADRDEASDKTPALENRPAGPAPNIELNEFQQKIREILAAPPDTAAAAPIGPAPDITAGGISGAGQNGRPADPVPEYLKTPSVQAAYPNIGRAAADNGAAVRRLQDRLDDTQELLKKVFARLQAVQGNGAPGAGRYSNGLLQFFYESLTTRGVAGDIAEAMLSEAVLVDEGELDIGLLVKIVYNTILNALGDPETIPPKKAQPENAGGGARLIAFIGPTGVGKTTTIAKLAARFIFDEHVKLGMVTADTYRIAAVEQLRTYAEILNIELRAAYDRQDMERHISELKPLCDLILIDTAGRSHKNARNLDELAEILGPAADCEKYLVLSAATKNEDLLDIVGTYSSRFDFRIIFTKLDETLEIGPILNTCYMTGAKLSYVTDGQNVPGDISVFDPEKLARTLLGLA